MSAVSVPDNIVMSILTARLAQLDCVSRGWVLHGYPRTREQAETLSKDGFVPNRWPIESCMFLIKVNISYCDHLMVVVVNFYLIPSL